MLHFYDFEVFSNDWLVVIINPILRQKTVIVNNRQELIDYYNKYKQEIFVGYNSSNYDQFILKSILLGINPKSTNDALIIHNWKGWQVDSRFKNVYLNNYDVMTDNGLKTLEGFMGNDIHECSVPFNINRKLTAEELDEVIKYCTNDVEQTIEVFQKRENDFNAQVDLIKAFNLHLDCIDKTQAQLASIILSSRKRNHHDAWEIRIPDNLKLGKYNFVADWFLNQKNHYENSELTCDVAGVKHDFGWGGVHGAKKQYRYTCKEEELLIMADVDQLYPTIMVRYGLLSRGIKEPKRYEEILATSLRLKAEGRKAERKPYKDICNITYGAMGYDFNSLYDPLHRKLVCVFGQLFLLDLIEKLEPFSEIIQSNTDGILIKINRSDFALLDDVVFEWEKRTGLSMSFDFYKKIVQKDVNNYIAVDCDGKMKRKGGYVKELNDLDNDLPIVNQAVVKFLVEEIPVEKTVRECKCLRDFQKIVKLSNLYKYAWHNGKQIDGKVFRVFASTDTDDSYIGKQKEIGKTVEKFANTPKRCFIDNSDVKNTPVPPWLDKQWYIDLAIKRIEDFGLNATNTEQMELGL